MTTASSAEQDQVAPARRSALSALAVYAERRTAVMLALGFSSGLPFLLIFDTLSAWLRHAGISLEVIGFFSLATLSYSFKFLWAPLIDRTMVPWLAASLGHRRSWMLVCQAIITLGLWLIAGNDPTTELGRMALFAVLVGFAAATQDIAMDAWRIEAAASFEQGVMAAAYQWGYRIAMIVAGAVPLLLADIYTWNFSYALMAALMSIGMLGVLAAPREAQHVVRPLPAADVRISPLLETVEWAVRLLILALGALLLGSGLAAHSGALTWSLDAVGLEGLSTSVTAAWRSSAAVWVQLLSVLAGFAVIIGAVLPLPGVPTRPGHYLSAALSDPLRDFFQRYRSQAALILALICLYRLSDFVLNIMNPFYLDLGFTLTEVAEIRKIFGVAMTVGGIFAGGFAVARLGLIRAMLIGAFSGPLSNLLFVWLIWQGHSLPALFIAIGLDNVFSSFAGTCLIAYMSSLTGKGFTATQYALFSSLYALPGKLIASQSGRIVESAAASADAGGIFSIFKGLFANISPETFVEAVERSGVTPAALASGYAAFFVYSVLIGTVAIVLAFMVAARQEGGGTGA